MYTYYNKHTNKRIRTKTNPLRLICLTLLASDFDFNLEDVWLCQLMLSMPQLVRLSNRRLKQLTTDFGI